MSRSEGSVRAPTTDHGAALSTDAEAARSLLKNLLNAFFHDRLVAVPTISAYIGRLQAEFGEDAAAAR
jgi:hypothetical protein